MQSCFDNIIIGSGAGGSAAAYQLIQSGQSVLILERGHMLPADGSTLDVNKVMRENSFSSDEIWLNRDGKTFTPSEYFNIGGKTKWYGAALLRFSEHEFESDSQHHCLAWPIRYADLAPYYDKAEQILDIKTFELEPQLKKITDKIVHNNDDGWVAHALPLGLSATIQQHPHEARHFDGFASVTGLKSDAQQCFIKAIENDPNFHCITGKQVSTLIPGQTASHVHSVECTDGSQYKARKVFLAAGALHSPRILNTFYQASGGHNDLTGRYYKSHLNSVLLAFSPARKTDLIRKTLLLLNERFPHSSIQTLGWLDGEILATRLPGWLPTWLVNLIGSRAYGFWLTSEDGSDKRNRIHFPSQQHTRPALDYDAGRLTPSMIEHKQLARFFKRRLLRIGMLSSVRSMPLAATAHACGTLVTGKHEQQSVVDPNGKVWGMDNLYVVDGSILPRSSNVNPALTIYAWALRTASLSLRQA